MNYLSLFSCPSSSSCGKFSEYGRSLDMAVKREMNSDLRRLMRILLTTEREDTEVNVYQAHKEAQVGTTMILFSLE